VAFPAWVLGHKPQSKIITASYGEELAELHSNEQRRVMQSAWYQQIFPNCKISAVKNSATKFDTTANGYRVATSVNGVMVGMGADLIVIDDPEKPSDVDSETKRNAVKEWYSNTVYSRLNEKDKGAIVVVTHRLHEDDFCSGLLKQNGKWHQLSLPAIADVAATYEIEPGKTHSVKAGDLLHPAMLSEETLREVRGNVGSYYFAAQYLQNPLPAGGGIVQWSWFKPYTERPKNDEFDYIVTTIDPALTLGEHSSFSAVTIWGIKGKLNYLLHVDRFKHELGGLQKEIIRLDQEWRPHVNVIETAGIGLGVYQSLRDAGFAPLSFKRPDKSKEVRLERAAPMIERGEVLIPDSAPWLADFRNEVKAFPKGVHDDQVDAMTLFLGFLEPIKREARQQAPCAKRPFPARPGDDVNAPRQYIPITLDQIFAEWS
jgi:predicted phage terminase large subunit-like protein